MYYLYNSRLNKYAGWKKNRLVYFQMEVDYYSNKANKINKNFQLIASTKKQLKDSWIADCTGNLLATTTSHTLLLELKITKSVYVCLRKT